MLTLQEMVDDIFATAPRFRFEEKMGLRRFKTAVTTEAQFAQFTGKTEVLLPYMFALHQGIAMDEKLSMNCSMLSVAKGTYRFFDEYFSGNEEAYMVTMGILCECWHKGESFKAVSKDLEQEWLENMRHTKDESSHDKKEEVINTKMELDAEALAEDALEKAKNVLWLTADERWQQRSQYYLGEIEAGRAKWLTKDIPIANAFRKFLGPFDPSHRRIINGKELCEDDKPSMSA